MAPYCDDAQPGDGWASSVRELIAWSLCWSDVVGHEVYLEIPLYDGMVAYSPLAPALLLGIDVRLFKRVGARGTSFRCPLHFAKSLAKHIGQGYRQRE